MDEIMIRHEDPDSADALACLEQYYAVLRQTFEEPFEVSRSLDPDCDALRLPLGAFLVARRAGSLLGCCGLKGDGSGTGEIKRLWVADAARGQGLARRLMDEAEARARDLGMTRLRLDTNRSLTAAIAMYHRLGWTEIPAFNTEPYAHHWFEKRLS
jgi:GNAT superfamily N-acetyltransferase